MTGGCAKIKDPCVHVRIPGAKILTSNHLIVVSVVSVTVARVLYCVDHTVIWCQIWA